MKKQLEDVVHVAVVNILSSGFGGQKNYVERDLMLAKVSTVGTSVAVHPTTLLDHRNSHVG